jgi:hypothetical protein
MSGWMDGWMDGCTWGLPVAYARENGCNSWFLASFTASKEFIVNKLPAGYGSGAGYAKDFAQSPHPEKSRRAQFRKKKSFLEFLEIV